MLFTQFREKVDKSDSYVICLIALLQVTIIVGGTLIVFGWSKFLGYTPDHPRFYEYVHFVRDYGVWFLLIPILWALLMVLSPSKDSSADVIGSFGFFTTLALIVFYMIVTFRAYRPSLLMVPKQSEKQTHVEYGSVGE